MMPMTNPSAQCYDLSTVFVANGLAPHTYPSGVVTSLTAGGVPQTCLSVGAPSGPSNLPQQPQLQFIATSGAGGPALIAANPGGPHVSNSGGGRYSSSANYSNSYYGHHQYNTYPKPHGGGGGHHRGGLGGAPNSNSGGGQPGKPYRSGKYANNNSGYMPNYHQGQQQHHSNHAPAIYTGYPQSTVTYHPQTPLPNYVVAPNAMNNSVELQQQQQQHPPALVATGPVSSNNLVLTGQQLSANNNNHSYSVVSSTLMNPPASTSAISNCVNTNTTVASSKDVHYAPTTPTEPRESREREQPQREPREARERQEPREQHREAREYREARGGPRDPRPLSKGNGYSSGGTGGYRGKRDAYANNYTLPYVPISSTDATDGSTISRAKPERSGSGGKFVRNSVADRSGPGGPQVPKSTTTLERERTGSATLPAASRPTRGHPTLHPIGGSGAGGAPTTAASAAAAGHSTAEQPFNLLATAFPPLPGMDALNPASETLEPATATLATSAPLANTPATTNHPSVSDAQGVGSNSTAGGTTPTPAMPTTKSHDTSLAIVVKGGGHGVATTASHSSTSSHHSEDCSATNYSDNSSQPLKSAKASTAPATVLLPSPTSPSVVLLNQGLSHEQSAKSSVTVASHSNSKASHKSSASMTNHESAVVVNSKPVASDSAVHLSKVVSSEGTKTSTASASGHTATSTSTNELPPPATTSASLAASNNNNTSVVAGDRDLVNHDSSGTSNHDYHHHKQGVVNHVGDSTLRHHSSSSVSFVRLSESSLSEFPLVTELPAAPAVSETSGQQSPNSSLTYAQIAQRQKAAKAL